jgi:LmbE family N-acetylglucosaminyl deacetylase
MMISAPAADSLTMPPAALGRQLLQAGNVLVVTARPGQESADLGGLLYAFRRSGASLALLCLTRGEASPLNSTWCRRLEAVRPWEVQLAANVLGIGEVTVASCPDGRLRSHPVADLTQLVRHAIRRYSADLLLVIAPEAGDPNDTAAARAACAAARQAGVPVVASTEPGARGGWMIDLGADAGIARAIQKSAAAAHQSQSQALPELVRRLDLLDGRESLRWLVPRPPRQSTTRRPRLRGRLPDRQRAGQHPGADWQSHALSPPVPGMQEPANDMTAAGLGRYRPAAPDVSADQVGVTARRHTARGAGRGLCGAVMEERKGTT